MGVDRQFLATLLVGGVFGASLVFVLQGQQIEDLRLQEHRWQQERADLERENQLLKAKLELSSPDRTVHKIEVEVRGVSGLPELEIQERVKTELEFLVGASLQQLQETPDLPAKILDGRIFKSDQEKYELHVNTIVVAETLYIVVTASPAGP